MYRASIVADFLLSIRSETPICRTFRPPSNPHKPLVEADDLSPIEILEAVAIAVEENALQRRACNQAALMRWQNSSLHGIYETGYNFFRSNFGYLGAFEIAAAIAFSGPIDIICHGENLDLEFVYPSARLAILARHCRNNVLRAGGDDDVRELFPTELFQTDYIETYKFLCTDPLWGGGFLQSNFQIVGDSETAPPDLESMFSILKSSEISFHNWQRSIFQWHSGGRAKGNVRHFAKVNHQYEYAPLVVFDDGARWNVNAPRDSNTDGESLGMSFSLWAFAIGHASAKRLLFGVNPPKGLTDALGSIYADRRFAGIKIGRKRIFSREFCQLYLRMFYRKLS